MTTVQTVIGLDVGTVRTGVAIGNTLARLAGPLTTLPTDTFAAEFSKIAAAENLAVIVVGLPRNLASQHTAQTEWVEAFAAKYLQDFTVVFQDEALTSEKAEAELKARKKAYSKADIDALAATYILQDYFENGKMGSHEQA